MGRISEYRLLLGFAASYVAFVFMMNALGQHNTTMAAIFGAVWIGNILVNRYVKRQAISTSDQQ